MTRPRRGARPIRCLIAATSTPSTASACRTGRTASRAASPACWVADARRETRQAAPEPKHRCRKTICNVREKRPPPAGDGGARGRRPEPRESRGTERRSEERTDGKKGVRKSIDKRG